MKPKGRPLLLPKSRGGASGSSSGPSTSRRSLLPRRSLVPSACSSCRLKKAKCDGQRPACRGCVRQSLECQYDTDEGETRSVALKRKHSAVEQEVAQLRELYDCVRNRSEQDAYDIFIRIRESDDPISVLRAVKDADILIANPSPDAGNNDPRVEKLNADALNRSPIKVIARPWTTIAGSGIVSELLSEFFTYENIFLFPAIDQEVFLEDVNKQDIAKAKFCSPLLVNAMCAQRCVTSVRTRFLGSITRQNMAEKFIDEAKKLLDLECGRATLPTVQALCIMYLAVALLGRDRAATMFRFMAMEMIKRLNLEHRFAKLNDEKPQEAREKRVISKALWAIFCFETRVSYFYSQRALLCPPSLPKYFDELGQRPQQFPDAHDRPPDLFQRVSIIPGIINAVCDLSEIFYDVMTHNTIESLDGRIPDDVEKRRQLYFRLREWTEALPKDFQPEHNFSFQSCFLQVYVNETIFCLLQPLSPELVLQGSDINIKDIIIQHCTLDTELFERYMKILPCVDLLTRGLYVSTYSLIAFLEDSKVHPLFIRNCMMLRLCIPHLQIAEVLLKAIQAIAWGLKKSIPKSASQCFLGLGPDKNSQDLPVSFTLPHQNEIQELLSDDGNPDTSLLCDQLGSLIARWSALSVD